MIQCYFRRSKTSFKKTTPYMRTGYVRGPDLFKFELPVHPGFHRIYTVFTVIGNPRSQEVKNATCSLLKQLYLCNKGSFFKSVKSSETPNKSAFRLVKSFFPDAASRPINLASKSKNEISHFFSAQFLVFADSSALQFCQLASV